jgi:hypothetical protein
MIDLVKFADLANSLVSDVNGVELRVEDRATGEYYKIDELAVDADRQTIFIVVNSDREGQR